MRRACSAPATRITSAALLKRERRSANAKRVYRPMKKARAFVCVYRQHFCRRISTINGKNASATRSWKGSARPRRFTSISRHPIEKKKERRRIERALQKLLEQKEMLLQEMSHRVANSLQIIASILLMKARTVDSPETRLHLQDAHRRVMSIASVQQHLQASARGEQIAVGPYLSKLCESLAASMIGDDRAISLKVVASEGSSTSSEAVSIGLIVTELVINALKHAFPKRPRPGQQVIVGYEANGENWKRSTSDNGAGMPDRNARTEKAGLGTSLIKALAQQLEAQVDVSTGPTGTTVSVTHATFVSRLPTAA